MEPNSYSVIADRKLSVSQLVMQGGFACFSVALLGVVVWMIQCNYNLQRETNKVIEQNTQAIERLTRVYGIGECEEEK